MLGITLILFNGLKTLKIRNDFKFAYDLLISKKVDINSANLIISKIVRL